MATETSSARPLVVVLLIVFFLLTGFMLVVAMQRSTEGRSRAAYPYGAPVPKGRCGIGGESSANGCCKGFAPNGGTCVRIQLREKSK